LKFPARFLLLSILALAYFTAPIFADTIAVQNASFEITNPLTNACGTGCAFNGGPIPGWTTTGGQQGSWQPSSAYFSAPVPDGSIVAYSNGGTISQTLSTSLAAQTNYLLTVAVGSRLDVGNITTYTIALYAGGVLLNALTASNALIPLGTFADMSVGYMSGAIVPSGNLSIVLSATGAQGDFDNVRLTTTTTSVSEPTSLTLLGAGLGLALLLFRRH
jgi:hypothetical protein